MPWKDPLGYEITTYLWVSAIAAWGGIAGYVRKLKRGVSRFSFGELIGDVVISAFVGIITFWGCQAAQINDTFSAALIGITGHMGSRAVYMIEVSVQKWYEKKIKGE